MNPVRLSILVLAITAPLTAQLPDAALLQARSLLRAGQADEAVRLLEKAVTTNPTDAARHYWLARAYGEAANEAGMLRVVSLARKAGAGFARAVELDLDFLEARFALMEYHLMAPGVLGGSRDVARAQAAEIRKRDPLAGHRAFAALAVAEKDFAAAKAEYLAALRDFPTSATALYDYGVFLMTETTEYAAAAQQFTRALEVDPGDTRALFQVGHVAALSGVDMDLGTKALRQYLEHQPGDDDPPLHRAHYWLGTIYEKQGMKAEAQAQFAAALRLRPGDQDARKALGRVS